ncbi:hypothetical protein FA95DRAFT_1554160 [Auriscalpium vulgare]|uniref:Uncharacterized protein n=1 Tax=Auriscalpium vulgare TaxID=40419 RepID=A0ACB8S608_9AGAM|nr:hypothetical protein FA95DRAFT_1554160 [Auriscalpium vulgare]
MLDEFKADSSAEAKLDWCMKISRGFVAGAQYPDSADRLEPLLGEFRGLARTCGSSEWVANSRGLLLAEPEDDEEALLDRMFDGELELDAPSQATGVRSEVASSTAVGMRETPASESEHNGGEDEQEEDDAPPPVTKRGRQVSDAKSKTLLSSKAKSAKEKEAERRRELERQECEAKALMERIRAGEFDHLKFGAVCEYCLRFSKTTAPDCKPEIVRKPNRIFVKCGKCQGAAQACRWKGGPAAERSKGAVEAGKIRVASTRADSGRKRVLDSSSERDDPPVRASAKKAKLTPKRVTRGDVQGKLPAPPFNVGQVVDPNEEMVDAMESPKTVQMPLLDEAPKFEEQSVPVAGSSRTTLHKGKGKALPLPPGPKPYIQPGVSEDLRPAKRFYDGRMLEGPSFVDLELLAEAVEHAPEDAGLSKASRLAVHAIRLRRASLLAQLWAGHNAYADLYYAEMEFTNPAIWARYKRGEIQTDRTGLVGSI